MNRIARWMMRLYPATWRARYGDEMDALLGDSGADAKTVADLLTGGIRMRLSKGSFLKLALMLGVAGMLLGLGGSYLLKPEYMSHATLEIMPVQIDASVAQRDATNRLTEMIQREQQQVMSMAALSRMINDPRLDLYSEERRSTRLEDVIDRMRANIGVAYMALPGRHASAFTIRFNYPDKVKAQQTVNALMSAFEEQTQKMQSDAPGAQGYVLKVLDTATLPVTAAKPDRVKFALFGCFLGFLVACAISAVRAARHSPSAPILATNE